MLTFKYKSPTRAYIEFNENSRGEFDRLRNAFKTENKAARFAKQFSYAIQPFKYPIAPLGSYLPGLTRKFIKWCMDNKVEFKIDEELKKNIFPQTYADYENIEPVQNSGYMYRDYQQTMIKALLKNGRGIIISPTRSGKSLILAGMFHNILLNQEKNKVKNILLVVPNLLLVEQFMHDLEEYYTETEETVKITLQNGRELILNGEDQVETDSGKKKASDLTEQDQIISVPL